MASPSCPTFLVKSGPEARFLERAALLLRRDTAPLAEIARACGFRSASHFFVRFNACFGVPPSHYRRSV
ncbi:MAG: helix-turn-helix domain-containing protein [Burkholderiales bacterium]